MKSELLNKEVMPTVGAPLKLAGKEYRITFPMAAVLRYKQKTGDNLFNVAHVIKIDSDPELLIAALWVGLQEFQPETKYEDAEAMLNVGTAPLISIAIAAAITSYLPQEVKDAVEASDPNAQSLQTTSTT